MTWKKVIRKEKQREEGKDGKGRERKRGDDRRKGTDSAKHMFTDNLD